MLVVQGQQWCQVVPLLKLYFSWIFHTLEALCYNQRKMTDPLWTELHCKEKMPTIWNKYSQKRNIGASVPISTFMCLWANYIFPRWVSLFCWRKYVDRSWEYINRSQTHECGNWGWGRAIPRKGIFKRNCRCSVGYCMYTKPLRDANDSTFKKQTYRIV